jgi:hypothetical protein
VDKCLLYNKYLLVQYCSEYLKDVVERKKRLIHYNIIHHPSSYSAWTTINIIFVPQTPSLGWHRHSNYSLHCLHTWKHQVFVVSVTQGIVCRWVRIHISFDTMGYTANFLTCCWSKDALALDHNLWSSSSACSAKIHRVDSRSLWDSSLWINKKLAPETTEPTNNEGICVMVNSE